MPRHIDDSHGRWRRKDNFCEAYRLTAEDLAHLKNHGVHNKNEFQTLLNKQKEKNCFCAHCRSIALKTRMQPIGGWLAVFPYAKWTDKWNMIKKN